MDLKKLLEALKDTTAMLEDFCNSTESKSCEKYAEEYIREFELEYIGEECKRCIRAGFRYALQQKRSGMFAENRKNGNC